MQTSSQTSSKSTYQLQVDKRDEGLPTTTTPPSTSRFDKQVIGERDADYDEAHAMYRNAIRSLEKRRAGPNNPPFSEPSPVPFPYIMKIQERRIPCEQHIAPYCQRMIISPEGPPIPLLDDDGQPITVAVEEDSPSFEDQRDGFEETVNGNQKKRRNADDHWQLAELFKRDDLPQSCHCRWVSPPPP